jgi:hypothetical protein
MQYPKPQHEDVEKRGKGKKLTREDFKKDVAEAVKRGVAKKKKPRKKRETLTGAFAKYSVAELRAFLNMRKKKLLTKSGFPGGVMPRSKAGMVALAKRLKRKRW